MAFLFSHTTSDEETFGHTQACAAHQTPSHSEAEGWASRISAVPSASSLSSGVRLHLHCQPACSVFALLAVACATHSGSCDAQVARAALRALHSMLKGGKLRQHALNVRVLG